MGGLSFPKAVALSIKRPTLQSTRADYQLAINYQFSFQDALRLDTAPGLSYSQGIGDDSV
jgi:hypothetical protein